MPDLNISTRTISPTFAQLALFFPPGSRFKGVSLAGSLDKQSSPLFRSEPNLIPLPADAPAEIPRLVYQDSAIGQLAVSHVRADLTMNWSGPETREALITTSQELASSLGHAAGIAGTRLGLVITCDLGGDMTVDSIRRHYFGDDKLRDIHELEIAWLRRIDVKGQLTNRWVRFQAFNRKPTLILDMNTLPELQLRFTEENLGRTVQDWFDDVWSDFDAILA